MSESKERLNRELIELLNELRIVIPGVTVVFAFLLTVPFSSGFGDLRAIQKDAYFVAFLFTLASMTFLMAPSAHHRLRFRAEERGALLPVWNVVTVIGVILLFFSFVAAAFLATSMMFSVTTAWTVAGAFVVTGGSLWFLAPFLFGSRS